MALFNDKPWLLQIILLIIYSEIFPIVTIKIDENPIFINCLLIVGDLVCLS